MFFLFLFFGLIQANVWIEFTPSNSSLILSADYCYPEDVFRQYGCNKRETLNSGEYLLIRCDHRFEPERSIPVLEKEHLEYYYLPDRLFLEFFEGVSNEKIRHILQVNRLQIEYTKYNIYTVSFTSGSLFERLNQLEIYNEIEFSSGVQIIPNVLC